MKISNNRFWLTAVVIGILLIATSSCEVETDSSSGSSDGYTVISDFDPLVGLSETQAKDHYNNNNYKNTTSTLAAVTGYDMATRSKGEMTEAAIADFVRRTNFFRTFHQLPKVSAPDAATNAKCQEAALSMIIQNTISHTPTDDGFTYAPAVAQEAASSSNLAIAWGSYNYTDLLNNLVMDTGVASTGHRKWFLHPGQVGAGYGYLYNTSEPTYGTADTLVQWTFETVDTSYDQPVLYPPAGAFPIEFVVDDFSRIVDFTLYWLGASFNNCSVTITNQSGNTITSTITLNEKYNAYSNPPAALGWRTSTTPTVGDKWTVSITGITGKSKSSLSYTINFISLGIPSTKSMKSMK